jgi:beta-glucanase (GH16 family)
LIWADEFDSVDCPGVDRWRHEEGFVRNDELQWYRRENAYCVDGHLVIEARRESVDNPRYSPSGLDWRLKRRTAAYTSASLVSEPSSGWLYGRFEVRVRIDPAAGLWPAFWSTGAIGSWPAGGEIDILEYFAQQFVVAMIWGGGRRDVTKSLEAIGGRGWAARFHVWRLEWDADSIQVYVDSTRLASFPIANAVNRDGSNPFRRPHVFRLNLAVGGSAGGDPAGTAFPARFEVDYFRVYRRRGEREPIAPLVVTGERPGERREMWLAMRKDMSDRVRSTTEAAHAGARHRVFGPTRRARNSSLARLREPPTLLAASASGWAR